MDFKSSKTYNNVLQAFQGESIARNKYTLYANKAREEGYEQIADLWIETANNEFEHSEVFFKYLHDGDVPHTIDNLQDSIDGEHNEWTNLYQQFANDAESEGYTDIANHFRNISNIEKRHMLRYTELLQNIEDNEVFSKMEKVIWRCIKCGHGSFDFDAPEKCPVCGEPKANFELACDNY